MPAIGANEKSNPAKSGYLEACSLQALAGKVNSGSTLAPQQPGVQIRERIMTRLKILAAALLAALVLPFAALAQTLPDLGGRKVVVVTENAYPPLQFVDPQERQADRLGI